MRLSLNFPFVKTSKTAPKGKVVSADERREVVSEAFRNPRPEGADVKRNAPDVKMRQWVEFVSDFKLTKLGDYDSYQRAGTKKLWATFHALDLIAKAMLSVDFKITKKDKKIEDENHPLVKLLVEPNPLDSWEDILYVWPFHIKFTGNAYWLKDEMNGKGQPSAVYPLLPQFIEVVPDRKIRVARYIYRVNGRVIELEPQEMLHFKNPHPNNVIFGLGDLEAGEPMFEDYLNRQELEKNYLGKGGMPSGVLTRKEEVEDPNEWKKFTKGWKEEYEGKENAGKTAFLNGDWSYLRLGLTPTELQSVERMQMTVKDIMILHGVPLSVAGFERAANYATSFQDVLNFKQWTVKPLLDQFCSKINSGKQLARTFDPLLRLGYELRGMVDVGGVSGAYGPLVSNGTMTRNELRVICEMEEVKGKPMMDEFLVPQGLVPIDMAGMGGGGMTDDEVNGVVGGNPPNQDPEEDDGTDDAEDPDVAGKPKNQPPAKDMPVRQPAPKPERGANNGTT